MGLIQENHRYSYSQLQSVSECPYGFYLQKIEKADGLVQNAFASQGTLIHDILDEWAKGILTIDQMPQEYERRYPLEVTQSWPRVLAVKGYAQKAFDLGYAYLKNFDGFPGYRIVDAEQKFETDIFGRPFVGIIDMLLEDEETGDLIVLDHKSKSLTAFKKAEDEMYKQQYLYAKHVFEKYDKWPKRLMFNLFKEGGLKKERPFKQDEYEETLKWALAQIEKIEQFDMIDWLNMKQPADFFCQELCSCRAICPNGKPQFKKKR